MVNLDEKTQTVQTMLDANSSLIVEIMNLHDAAKQKRVASENSALLEKISAKQKLLSKNLETLAGWADRTTEAPSAPTPLPPPPASVPKKKKQPYPDYQLPPTNYPKYHQPSNTGHGMNYPRSMPSNDMSKLGYNNTMNPSMHQNPTNSTNNPANLQMQMMTPQQQSIYQQKLQSYQQQQQHSGSFQPSSTSSSYHHSSNTNTNTSAYPQQNMYHQQPQQSAYVSHAPTSGGYSTSHQLNYQLPQSNYQQQQQQHMMHQQNNYNTYQQQQTMQPIPSYPQPNYQQQSNYHVSQQHQQNFMPPMMDGNLPYSNGSSRNTSNAANNNPNASMGGAPVGYSLAQQLPQQQHQPMGMYEQQQNSSAPGGFVGDNLSHI